MKNILILDDDEKQLVSLALVRLSLQKSNLHSANQPLQTRILAQKINQLVTRLHSLPLKGPIQ